MNKADYQMIAVALREGKKELLNRGIAGHEVDLAVGVIQANLTAALLADSAGVMDIDAFSKDARYFGEQMGRAISWGDYAAIHGETEA